MRIVLIASEVQYEPNQSGRRRPSYIVIESEFVQISHETARLGPDGDDFANYSDGFWTTVPFLPVIEAKALDGSMMLPSQVHTGGMRFTDIIIMEEDS